MTVMGEEDIEPEIEEHTETIHRARRLAEVDAQTESMDKDGEFATPVAKELFRSKRKVSAEANIIALKRQQETPKSSPTFSPAGFFLTTPAEVSAYRAKRKQDIVEAIARAKTFEDI